MEKPNGFVCVKSLIHQLSSNSFWPANGKSETNFANEIMFPSGFQWNDLMLPLAAFTLAV